MNGWRFVEQERLKVGDALPEGCALMQGKSFRDGEIVWSLISSTTVRIKKSGEYFCWMEMEGGGGPTATNEWLFRVVEPAPQRLGRLPKLGEKFWVPVEVKCIELDPLSEEPAYVSSLGWLSEADLGIDNSAKRAELEAARARVAELERELGVNDDLENL